MLRPSNTFVIDIGKKMTHVLNTETQQYSKHEHTDLVNLNFPDLRDGDEIIGEAAHFYAQEDNSLAQALKIDDLKFLKNIADSRNIRIRLFPQKVTPKARKVNAIGNDNKKLLEKTDFNDILAIDYYLKKFPNVLSTLKSFNPCTYEEYEKKVSHIYTDREKLNEQVNLARNEEYGIGKTNGYADPVTIWIKKNMIQLAFRLDNETREWVGFELKNTKNGLKDALVNYTSSKLKFIYQVVVTVLDPDTGEPRLRSDNGKPAFWKYSKHVHFGLTPHHMNAGVTASNYKHWKRRFSCDKSMSLESKKAIKSLDDIFEIQDGRNICDKKLRTFWREVRKMIVEEGIR